MIQKHRRGKNKTHFKARRVIFLVGLMVLLALFSAQSVSAWDFDNVKDYNESLKEITITNALGFGDKIADIRLITPINFNVIDEGEGILQKVAEFQINSNEEYTNVFKEMEFFNVNDLNINIDRKFIYKKKVIIGQEEIIDYNTTCLFQINPNKLNGTLVEVCNKVFIGKHQEDIYEWKNLDNELVLLNKGNITIGIFTDVQKDDNVEWIPTLYGVRIEEFATWTESLYNGIVGYYNFNETTGTNGEEIIFETNNWTLMGGVDWTTGLIGNGLEFGGGDEWLNTTPILKDGASDFSVSLWINTSSLDATMHLFNYDTIDADGNRFLIYLASGDSVAASIAGGSTIGNLNHTNYYNDSNWHHIAFTANSSGQSYLYYDGGIVASAGGFNANLKKSGKLEFGRDYNGVLPYVGLMDEMGWWDRSLSTDEITNLYTNSYNLSSSSIGIILSTLNTPTANQSIYKKSIYENQNYTFNITSRAYNGGVLFNLLFNVSLYINDLFVDYKNISGSENESNFDVRLNDYSIGTNNWTAITCNIDNICDTATYDFKLVPYKKNSEIYNSTTTETKFETFNINISSNGMQNVTGNLIYNGTSYTGTKTGNNNEMIFSKSMDIPIGNVTNPFHWNVTIGNNTYSITSNNQTVNLLNYSLCDATNNVVFMNITFKDETDDSVINASIPTSSWVYYLGEGSVNKSYTYINTGEESNYTFCSTPADETLNVEYTMRYESTGYPQRTFGETLSLTNSTLEKVLYLLASGDGQYVTFQVINTATQTISGVFVNATRTISGSEILIGSGNTDASGTITFWMNPNFAHNLVFEKEGFNTYSTTITPTQIDYTITLGGGTTPLIKDYTKNIEYPINPTIDLLNNNTNYVFNLTLSSSYWEVTEFGFVLTNSTNSALDSSTIYSNGGTATTTFNTNNYSEITMNYYWIIEGNYTNGTRSWKVYDDTIGNDWSVLNFITLVKTYKEDGIFGLDDFGVAVITFIIIFIIIGIMAFKFGFDNDAGLIILFACLVAIADFGFNLFPSIGLGTIQINHVATIIVVLISITILVMEGRK